VRERVVRPGGLYFLSKALIGFPDLTRRAHFALALVYEFDHEGKLVEFPKSHLKTSIGTVGRTLHIHACRAIRGEDLSDRLALASNTKTNSMRFLRLVKQVPESNIVFQNFIPELLPEFSNEEVWNQQEIIFPRRGAYTDPSVDTLGVGGAATSRHYTGIIEDDMLKEEDADSPSAIRKCIELHQYYTSLLVPDVNGKNGWYVVNEHSWTEYDLNKHVVDKEPDTLVFSVGASGGLNTRRSRHLPSYITDLTDEWNDRQGVWPERFGYEELLRRRQKAGARVYNAVYENDPFDPDVVDFKEEWLRYYEWTHDSNIRIMPKRGVEMEVLKYSSLNIVAAYDPALSEKTTADRSALVVVGVDPQRRVFILDVYARRQDPMKYIDEVIKRVWKWDIQQCAVESVLFQKVLYENLRSRCQDWNRTHKAHEQIFPGVFREVKPPPGKHKDARIRALIGTAFEEGRVYIHPNLGDFIDEYLHFPIGQTKDILDAFAYTVDLWSPGTDEEDWEDFQQQEREWLAQRDAVTGY
jgi:hypothetical protein